MCRHVWSTNTGPRWAAAPEHKTKKKKKIMMIRMKTKTMTKKIKKMNKKKLQ